MAETQANTNKQSTPLSLKYFPCHSPGVATNHQIPTVGLSFNLM